MGVFHTWQPGWPPPVSQGHVKPQRGLFSEASAVSSALTRDGNKFHLSTRGRGEKKLKYQNSPRRASLPTAPDDISHHTQYSHAVKFHYAAKMTCPPCCKRWRLFADSIIHWGANLPFQNTHFHGHLQAVMMCCMFRSFLGCFWSSEPNGPKPLLSIKYIGTTHGPFCSNDPETQLKLLLHYN